MHSPGARGGKKLKANKNKKPSGSFRAKDRKTKSDGNETIKDERNKMEPRYLVLVYEGGLMAGTHERGYRESSATVAQRAKSCGKTSDHAKGLAKVRFCSWLS